jgi:hypothetical protein
MDLRGLVETMIQGGAFTQVVNNPLAQFGTPDAPFLLASLLPEREVPVNDYTEEGIRYRTVIANAGTRYSPAQKKGGAITGAFKVSLGNSDIAAEFTSSDYDALIRSLERFTGANGTPGGVGNRPMMEAVAQIVRWADNSLNQPLLAHNELQRSQALCAAQITLLGDNNYREVINLPNPSGARVAAGGTWSSNTYDPLADMQARRNYLAKKGYKLSRIITSTDVMTILANNAKIQARAGFIGVASGVVTGQASYVDLQGINNMIARDGLPPLELYDRVYFTSTSYGYYLPRDTMIFVAGTGRDERVERGDLEPVVQGNTLGYTAIGRAAGQNAPGRVIPAPRVIDNQKPPRIEGQAWQTSLAVVTDPEAVTVINTIA